tara:strand:- start:574 stop:891 length:318 start_codon:yes stop_codon:yes gene_type:complete
MSIGYIVKDFDNIPVEGRINIRISYDKTRIIEKIEIALDGLGLLSRDTLKTLAESMAITVSENDTEETIIAEVNNTVKTHEEIKTHIAENNELWNPEPGTYEQVL